MPAQDTAADIDIDIINADLAPTTPLLFAADALDSSVYSYVLVIDLRSVQEGLPCCFEPLPLAWPRWQTTCAIPRGSLEAIKFLKTKTKKQIANNFFSKLLRLCHKLREVQGYNASWLRIKVCCKRFRRLVTLRRKQGRAVNLKLWSWSCRYSRGEVQKGEEEGGSASQAAEASAPVGYQAGRQAAKRRKFSAAEHANF